jgi:hypothetical protein
MPSTRKLNAKFELTVRENGQHRGQFGARGDILKIATQGVVATVFGEGATVAAAEDQVWVEAQEWLLKRGRAR